MGASPGLWPARSCSSRSYLTCNGRHLDRVQQPRGVQLLSNSERAGLRRPTVGACHIRQTNQKNLCSSIVCSASALGPSSPSSDTAPPQVSSTVKACLYARDNTPSQERLKHDIDLTAELRKGQHNPAEPPSGTQEPQVLDHGCFVLPDVVREHHPRQVPPV